MDWFTQIDTADQQPAPDLYQNAEAAAFLDTNNSNQYFVCGLKGVGKTLLLKHKSARLRHDLSGIIFLPETQLTETLASFLFPLDDKKMQRLSIVPTWQLIWGVVLSTIILKKTKSDLPPAITRIFPDLSESFSAFSHLVSILNGNVINLIDKTLPATYGALNAKTSNIRSGIYLFLDAVDEFVILHSGDPLRLHEKSGYTQYGRLSADIWMAAQIGFAKASLDLMKNNSHIKIFGAFRYEAMERYPYADRQNIEPHILHIQYSREDLKRLFIRKLTVLRNRSPEIFVNKSEDLVESFLGFSELSHSHVKQADRTPLKESAIDYILRHTRGRPRELDEIGRALQALDPSERSVSSVRERIRIRSSAFFNWAKDESIPFWNPENDDVIRKMRSNVVSHAELQRLRTDLNQPDAPADVFSDLFRNGLLGCVCAVYESEKQIRFRQSDPLAPVTDTDFESSEFYVVHPCVNIATYPEKSDYFPNPWNVSAHGGSFLDLSRKGHIHIGAGALGLGFVVPLFASDPGLGICVLQRANSERWSKLANSDLEDITLEHKVLDADSNSRLIPKVRLTLVTSRLDETRFKTLVAEWSRGERHLLVLTEFTANPLLEALFSEASTISTALGIRGLAEVGGMIAQHGRPGSVVYPFENDEQSIAKLGEVLRKADIEIIEVCADRICLTPIINATTAQVEVEVESFSHADILDKSSVTTSVLLPEGSSNSKIITVYTSRDQYEFARLRKRVLVNGIHFFFGLASLAYIRGVAPYDPSVARTVGDARATQLFVRASEVRDKVDLCNRLFLIQLLLEAEKLNVISNDDECASLQRNIYKQQALITDRLENMPDRMSRILNPSDDNFLRKGRTFLQNLRSLPQNLAKSKIVKSGMTIADLEKVQREVVDIVSLYLDELLGR